MLGKLCGCPASLGHCEPEKARTLVEVLTENGVTSHTNNYAANWQACQLASACSAVDAASPHGKRLPMPLDPEAFGGRLEEAIKARGLTDAALGEIAGVDAGHIGRMQRGERLPGLKVLVAITEALDIGIEWLIYGSDMRSSKRDRDSETRQKGESNA